MKRMKSGKKFSPKNNTIQAKQLLILAVIVVVTLLVAMKYLRFSKPDPSKMVPELPQPVQQETESIVTTGLRYQNDQWGFELELPTTWQGYLVSEPSVGRDESNSGHLTDVCFYFERAGSIPACILQISVFDKAKWMQYTQRGGKQVQPLFESEEYVYISNQYDPACVQLDAFQCSRSQEITAIQATFRLTK